MERTPQQALPTDVYRVYEATDPFHDRPYRLGLRLARVKPFMNDIQLGRRLLTLGDLVLETRDQALARSVAQVFYS